LREERLHADPEFPDVHIIEIVPTIQVVTLRSQDSAKVQLNATKEVVLCLLPRGGRAGLTAQHVEHIAGKRERLVRHRS
jgi:hypothetical protein